jgi:tripartite-type tricarboxylate transporter receptor subunit TctC
MKFPRRQFLHLAAGAAALPAVSRIARAQVYPTRPVHLVVGFAAAGGTDITARLIGQSLSERLGQPFVVENRPGGGSSIATAAVVNAPADGYTLLVASHSNAINATLYNKLTYNFLRDTAPVAGVVRVPLVIVVNPSVPVNTLVELISYAKANSGRVNMGSAGVGSGGHLAGELFKMMADVTIVHVPYRSAGPALTDLLGGQVQVVFAGTLEAIEYIKAGRLRALAVTAATRSDALPDLPTVSDFIPGYEASGWYGIAAPKNTPVEIIDKLNKEINSILADPSMKSRLADLGGVPMPITPADFSNLIADETEKWAKVIRAANIKIP